jgi:hypothetical protein
VISRVSSQDIHSFALPNLTKKDLGAFHELLAMHFYTTGRSFALIELKAGRRFFLNVDLISFSGKEPFCLGA